jgi:sugar phosphate isomerase/epimerase
MVDFDSRRGFLRGVGVVGAGVLLGGVGEGNVGGGSKGKPQKDLRLGLASYTFRKFKVEQAISMTGRVRLKNVCFKSMHLPLNSSDAHIAKVVAAVKRAKLNLYGCGVVYMKSEADVNRAFEYARAAGMKVIVGVPKYELLGLVEKKVIEYDIKVAIHNHGPGDKVYPTGGSVWEKVKGLDKRIGLCLDIGHSKRIGEDPVEAIEKYASRLHDVHIKDVSEASKKGHTVEIGRGVIDIVKVIRTLLSVRYKGVVAFEYEKGGKDPLAGLAESVGYVRGVIAGVW